MNEDLKILRKTNSELTKERDKISKDYLELYARVEKTKDLLKEKIKKEQYKIETNEYVVMFLEELGDLKEIYDTLEKRKEEVN